MPVKVSNLPSITAETDMPVGGESLHLVYRPNYLTPAVEKQFKAQLRAFEAAKKKAAETGEELGLEPTVLFDQVKGLIESWDLLGDGDDPLPLTDESFQELPYTFLAAVVQHVMEASSPVGRGGKGPRS
jgi:hypothetical protein